MIHCNKRIMRICISIVIFSLSFTAFSFFLRYEGRIIDTYIMPAEPKLSLTVEDAIRIISPEALATETEYHQNDTLVFKPDIPVAGVRIVYTEFPEEYVSAVIEYTPLDSDDREAIKRMKYSQKGSNEILFAFPVKEFDDLYIKVHDIADVQRIDLYDKGAYVDTNKVVPRAINRSVALLLAAMLGIVYFVSRAELHTGKGIGFPILYFLLEMAVLRYSLKTRGYEFYSQDIEVLTYALFTVASIVLCVIYRMLFVRNTYLHRVFVLSAMTIGVFMMLMIQPYSGLDEKTHYLQAYMRSNELLGIEPIEENQHQIRWEDLRVFEKYGIEMSVDRQSVLTTYQKYAALAQNAKFMNDSNETRLFVRDSKITSVPLGYCFSTLGLTVSRVLNLSGLLAFYLGRFANLVFYIAIVSVAIKIIPFGKAALMGIAITPIAMQQAATYSYDGVVAGLAFLFISYVLKLFAQEEKISLKQFLIVCGITVIFAPSKAVYFPMIMAILLIPTKKYGFGKQKWIYNTLIILLGMAALFGIQMSGIKRIAGVEQVLSDKYSVSYILANAGEIVNMVLSTFETLTDTYLFQMINYHFAWHQFSGSFWIAVVACVLIVLGSQRCNDEVSIVCHPMQRCGALIVALGIVLLIFITLMMDHTPMGNAYITGVQGRYFIPIAIILIPVLRNAQITVSNRFHRWCAFTIVWLYMFAVVDALSRIPFEVYVL